MLRKKIEAVLDILSFRSNGLDLRLGLLNGSWREWDGVMHWLDSSGLALYFLSRLECSNLSDAVPEQVLCQLNERQARNRLRMEAIRCTFDSLNREFSSAAVEYLVLKGFSLLPEFSEDESLRAQSDLDYLIAPTSLGGACRVLEQHGYVFKKRTGQEFVFWIPSEEPSSSREQYDANAPYNIELHTTLWDDTRLHVRLPEVTLGSAKVRQWKECIFPSLREAETFYYQVLHAFRHFVDGKVRLCHFYEIARFLNRSVDSAILWHEIENILGPEPKLREIAGLVSAMAFEVFSCRRPAVLTRWSQELRPAVRLWKRNYSRNWLIEGAGESIRFFSSAKLAFLLQDQYVAAAPRRARQWRSLLPIHGLKKVLKARSLPPVNPGRTRQLRSKVLSRVLYHLGSNLRYAYEVPRWHLTKRYWAHSSRSHVA